MKTNLFKNISLRISYSNGKNINRKIYVSTNYNLDSFCPEITFAIKPTKKAKETFIKLMNSYNKEDNTGILLHDITEHWESFDILNTMRFGNYKIINKHEIILSKAVIKSYYETEDVIVVNFDDKFKEFLDKYFTYK